MHPKHILAFEIVMAKNLGFSFWVSSLFRRDLVQARWTRLVMFIWSWSQVAVVHKGENLQCLALTFCNFFHLVAVPHGFKLMLGWRDDESTIPSPLLEEAPKHVAFQSVVSPASTILSKFMKWGIEQEKGAPNLSGVVISFFGVWHVLKHKQSALMYWGKIDKLEKAGRLSVRYDLQGKGLTQE